MSDSSRDRLLASYGDMGEAMVVQNVLQAGGVSCRLVDLAQVPSHMFGIAGGLNRSVGLWVREDDVERASALLASLQKAGADLDEDELTAEALAAAPSAADADTEPEQVVVAERHAVPATAREPRSPLLGRMLLVSGLALAALLAFQRCG